jgi:hypothetical protein
MTTSTTSLSSSLEGSRTATRLPDIAIVGKAGAGKTTAAEHLHCRHGYLRVSFANILKDVAATIWGPEARTDRDKLQRLGVAVREIDQDAWVNAARRTIEGPGYGKRGFPIVVDDCRFPNEYWMLKELGFRFLRVHASETLRVDRLQRNGKLQDISQLNHVSETAIDDTKDFPVDHNIWNEGLRLLDYQIAIDSVLNKELSRS